MAAKRAREEIKQLTAILATMPPSTLAEVLAASNPEGAKGVMGLLPTPSSKDKIVALEKAGRGVSKAAHCFYSTSNAFSYNRASPFIATLVKLVKEQASAIAATKDAAAVALWATAALATTDAFHKFDAGITNYISECKGIVGKTAATMFKSKEGKGASADVKKALETAAAFAPALTVVEA